MRNLPPSCLWKGITWKQMSRDKAFSTWGWSCVLPPMHHHSSTSHHFWGLQHKIPQQQLQIPRGHLTPTDSWASPKCLGQFKCPGKAKLGVYKTPKSLGILQCSESETCPFSPNRILILYNYLNWDFFVSKFKNSFLLCMVRTAFIY